MNGWIPVAQEMPDSDLTVLIHMPSDPEPVWMGYHDGSVWRGVDARPCFNLVTHWMQLPEPPKPV